MKQIGIFVSFLIGSLCLVLCILLSSSDQVKASNLMEQFDQPTKRASVSLAVIDDPETVAKVLESLLRSILYSGSFEYQINQGISSQKRGLDLGMTRGFSGSQAGKHLMGLSAASFANGPGKR